jgi:acetyltransferase
MSSPTLRSWCVPNSRARGLGGLLLQSIIDYSRSRGTGELRGETLDGNLRMQKLARKLGFTLKSGLDVGTIELRLPLHDVLTK